MNIPETPPIETGKALDTPLQPDILPEPVGPAADEHTRAESVRNTVGDMLRPALHTLCKIGKAAIGPALFLAPVGAGVAALEVAPPAVVHDAGLDGVNMNVDLQIGSNSVVVDGGLLGEGQRASSVHILDKDFGVHIQPDVRGLSLLDSKGSPNPATVSAIGHIYADKTAQKAELRRITSEVEKYYETVGLGAAYVSAMLEILAYAYVKDRRHTQAMRTEDDRNLIEADRQFDRRAAKSVAAALVLSQLVVLGTVMAEPNHSTLIAPTALPGISNKYWQITGPLSGPLAQAIGAVNSYSTQERSFYDLESKNLKNELLRKYGDKPLAKDPNKIRFIILDDLQGVSGMTQPVGEVAHYVNADAIINLGDMTTTGSEQESYLSLLKSYAVSSLSANAGPTPVYTSLGRHDTPVVSKYAQKVHITVANGKVQKIAGIPTIGFNSPYIVNFGQTPSLVDPAITSAIAAQNITDAACNSKVLIVYGHDKEYLDALKQSGCVPIIIGGHSYSGEPVENFQTTDGNDIPKQHTVRVFTLGSTGGHSSADGLGGPTQPRNTAPFVSITIDKLTGIITYDIYKVHPDASVSVESEPVKALTKEDLAIINKN